jgi:hypothetical protein
MFERPKILALIRSAFETGKEYQKLKLNKPLLDGECSKLIDQRKQAKLQWLQNQNQINGDNLKNLRNESRISRKKKRE